MRKNIIPILLAGAAFLAGCAGEEKPKELHTITISSLKDLQHYFLYSLARDVIISGHRGGMMEGFPENCIASFERTLELMPSFFEIDPRLTRDSVLVLMHDATIDRTTTGKGRVEDYTYEELLQFDLVDRDGNVTPYKIPTLDEVLEWGKDKVVWNFDNKKVPWEFYSRKLSTDWKDYHNIMLSVRSLEECLYYFERHDQVMFCVEISDWDMYEAYAGSGIPWDRLMAYVKYTMEPDKGDLYARLRSHGVMCMTSIHPTADRVEPLEARIEAYKQELAVGPDIIETDYPALFVGLSLKKGAYTPQDNTTGDNTSGR